MYILNRVTSKSVYKTPFELWKRWKPSLNHIHIWSCPAEVRIYNLNIKKLDPRTTSGFFIGYQVTPKDIDFIVLVIALELSNLKMQSFLRMLNLVGV